MTSFLRYVASVAVVFLAVARPALAAPEAFVEDLRFGAPGTVQQLIYAPEYGKLVMRASTVVRVLDLQTGTLTAYTPTGQFTDMSRAPEGRYVYVADYGGENIGYSSPLNPSRVGRIDLQLGTWESRTTSDVAHHIEATAANRFILKGIDQWVEFTYHEWTTLATITTLNPGGYYGSVYSGDFEFNTVSRRLIHGNSGSSSTEIRAFNLLATSFSGAESTGTYGSASGYGGTAVLSTDGADFYYGRLQVDGANVTVTRRAFAKPIVAATGDVAFADGDYYDADTGQRVDSLSFGTTVYGLNRTGADFWAYNPGANSLHHFVPQSAAVNPGSKANLDIFAVPNIQATSLDVLANDSGFTGTLTVTLTVNPSHGTATIVNSPGDRDSVRVRYVATAGYVGPDNLAYEVTDGVTSSSANVALTVKALQARNDTAVALRSGCCGSIYVLRNDIGLGATATVRIVQQPRNGYAYVSTSSATSPDTLYVQYSPNYGGSGETTDSFVYEVTSGGNTDTAAVAVRVVDFIAQDDTAIIGTGRTVTVDVTSNDLGFNWPRTIGMYTNPQHGTAMVMPSSGYYYDQSYIQYTPAPGFLGTDTIEYFIDDGTRIDTAIIRVNVIVDGDDDKIDDGVDNCVGAANGTQRDTDGDRYGNWCDGDFNGDGSVNFGDLATFRSRFATSDPHADLDGNGVVNFADLARFKALFGKAPGPSALVP